MNGTQFKLRFKCGEVREVTFSEAKSKWTDILIVFCQKCLSWVPPSNDSVAINEITESINAIPDPNEIICEHFT